MKNKILQEFLSSNIEIKSIKKLTEYIDYCIDNNKKQKIKGETALHHILPKSLFAEYSNINRNIWNGTHLSYYDHYYVHWLLINAIDNYSMIAAFTKMHNCFNSGEIIEEKNLIPKAEFKKIVEEEQTKRSERLSEVIIFENKELTRFDVRNIKQSRTKNNPKWKQTKGKKMIERLKETVLTEIVIDGKSTTKAKEVAKKAAKTMKDKGIYKITGDKISKANLRLEENGLSVAQNRNINTGKYKRETLIEYNGELMSISKSIALKVVESKKKNGTILSKDKHPSAIIVEIYDENDNLIAVSNGNLKETCDNIGISFKSVMNSYKTGKRIYENAPPKNKIYKKFKNWKAVKI